VEYVGAVLSAMLFWLPRIGVLCFVLAAAIWGAEKGWNWVRPQRGDTAPEFEAGSVEQNALLARLLQAEFMQIKVDLGAGAEAVRRLLQAWTTEFEEVNRKRQLQSHAGEAAAAPASLSAGDAKVIQSEVRTPVDLTRVAAIVDRLEPLSQAISPANVPDIKIANVELGPVLRWVIDLVRAPSENKVIVFDEKSSALIEGPIVPDGRTILEFEQLSDAGKRTAVQIAEPIAYQILASKLAKTDPKIDFGNWTALRNFVVGTRNMAKLVSQPGLGDRAAWDKQVTNSASLIEQAGATSGDWKFIALVSFLFERARNYDAAIRVLEQYAELTRGRKEDEDGRTARLAYLRDRRVEAKVGDALGLNKADGAVFEVTTTALAALPVLAAARKQHRLDGVATRTKVKVAIVSGAKPRWFALDAPPDLIPAEDQLDIRAAELAQVVRALSPSAEIVFVPVTAKETDGVVRDSDLLAAVDTISTSDIPVILVPFGPLGGTIWAEVLDALQDNGHLVIIPAGNSGSVADSTLATKALLAESIEPAGRRASYSSQVAGSLGAVGELPMVDLTDAGPVLSVRRGTSFAAAALAAIAAESIARQPTLRGAGLREALLKAAAQPADSENPPVARVVIPR
jgi:Subtilase family